MERYVGVVGPGEATAVELALATEVGERLAQRGAIVVTGGLGGVMAAALQGSQRGGGRSLSLLPGADRSAAGAPATIVVPTALGQLRNGLLVNAVDGIVAVGGSWGTLSEVALARRAARPVVWLEGWAMTDRAGHRVDLDTADTAQAAVDGLLAQLDVR
jgi:uncharacterized protein (TIGR00725 family)